MALFPSEEWISRYRDLINGSEEYREAAQTWEGDIAFYHGGRARSRRDG